MKKKLSTTQRKAVRKIRHLHSENEPLNISAVRRRHPELLSLVYSQAPFWGWKVALEDAGVDYGQIRVELLSSVECRLCGKEFRRLAPHLLPIHETTVVDYRVDYPDSEAVCEESRSIQMGGGSSYRRKPKRLLIPHWEPIWSPEYVLDRMAELHRQGFDLSHASVDARDQVADHAVKYFQSWDEPLRKIGIDPADVRVLSPTRELSSDDVLAKIRERDGKQWPVSVLAVRKGEYADLPLWRWACHYYGTWHTAVDAAGVEWMASSKHPFVRFPDSESVLMAIRKRKSKGQALNLKTMQMPVHGDKRLFIVAGKEFGSWAEAIEAAGLDYGKIRQRQPNPYQSKKAIVREIQRRHKERLPLTCPELRRGEHRDVSLLEACFKRFGKWSEAKKAARIDSCSQRKAKK